VGQDIANERLSAAEDQLTAAQERIAALEARPIVTEERLVALESRPIVTEERIATLEARPVVEVRVEPPKPVGFIERMRWLLFGTTIEEKTK
jgi:hypothetical protein